ncbi:U2 small nuclear ribonucleoprotein A' [Nymphon striatum]|nr:U2 small nuclear ribonucleoprotein A' [Nymphon striatum]
MQELGDIDHLASVKSLRTLSLLRNPLAVKKYYREYVIYKLPQLKLLDFRKIKMKEREAANQLFMSKRGKQLEKELAKRSKTFVPGAAIPSDNQPSGPSAAQIKAIKDAIANATSLEEIDRLKPSIKIRKNTRKISKWFVIFESDIFLNKMHS